MSFKNLRKVHSFKRPSLGREILLWMSLVGIVPFFILALPEFFLAEKMLIAHEKQSILQALNSRVYQVEEWLRDTRKDLSFISHSNCVQGLCSHSCATKTSPNGCPVQESVLKSNPSFQSIQAYDQEMTLISHSGRDDSCFSDLSADQLNKLFENQKDYFISDNYCFKDNRTFLTIGQRIRQPAQDKTAFIVAHLDMHKAIDLLLAEPFMTSGKFYILSKEGQYLYPPKGAPFLHRTRNLQLTKFLSQPNELQEYYNSRKEPVLGALMPVPRTGWFLVKEVDKNIIMKPRVIFSSRSVLAGFCTLGLVLLTSFMVSRRISGPLEKMAETANSIVPGDNAAWQKFPPFPSREIDQVGRSFNEMLDRLRESEQALIKASSMAAIGEFSSRIVHEMRSPLSSINLALRSLYRNQHNEQDQERIKIVLLQARRLMRLLDQTLNYGKPLEINYEKINFRQLAEELQSLVAEILVEKNLIMDLKHDCLNDQDFLADRELLIQALVNILANAVYWTPTGGLIEMEGYPKPGNKKQLTIRIADRGPGIDQGLEEKIFHPFFSTRKEGTGLGLAITRKIIELHDGTITVANRKSGGTEIYITIPMEGTRRS